MDTPSPEQFGISRDDLNALQSPGVDVSSMALSLGGWGSFVLLAATAGLEFWPLAFLYFIPGMLTVAGVHHAHSSWSRHRARRSIDPGALARYQVARAEFDRSQRELQRAERAALDQERRKLREQEAWWKSLDGSRFERELTSYLRERGCGVTRTGGSGDGGIDLEVRLAGQRIIVQCKAHAQFVSPGPVRDLYGTLLHSGADEAWLVTTSGFYRGARIFAEHKPLRLITIRQLLEAKSLPLSGREDR